MSAAKTGGPAFPSSDHNGLTLRDYFAAKAMQAFIMNTDKRSADEADLWVGRAAYEVADAMLDARSE